MAKPDKYTHVATLLRTRIDAGAFVVGEPLPAENLLAAEYGVHRLTLRKALDVLSQERVIIRRHGCGTFTNPAAARRKMTTVLYVGSTTEHVEENIYRALCGEAQDRGMAVLAAKPDGDDAERLAQFRELVSRHRRLICMEREWSTVKPLIGADVHVTRVSGFYSVGDLAADERPGYVISSDLYRAFKIAVEHLVKLGHRRIGLLDIGWTQPGDPLLGGLSPRRDSVLGYRAALQENGLADEWLLAIPDRPGTEDYQAHEAESVRRHFDTWKTMPTAILCAADFRVPPLLRVLRERGLRVPEDVSVMGVGNTPWTLATDPPLTSVCLGENEMARLALMLNAEPQPQMARVVRVDPELVVRKSTKRVNSED